MTDDIPNDGQNVETVIEEYIERVDVPPVTQGEIRDTTEIDDGRNPMERLRQFLKKAVERKKRGNKFNVGRRKK